MQLKIEYLLQIIVIFNLVFAATCFHHHGSHGSHGTHGHGGSSHRQKGKKGVHFKRAEVVFPTGNVYYTTVPYLPKGYRCTFNTTLIDLNPTGKMGKKEYNIVQHELAATNKGGVTFQIVKIQKIVNTCLWERYQYRKVDVIKEAKNANERMLFHGSKSAIALVNGGFDERYANVNGYFGAGLYFAENSSKSHGYTSAQPDGTRLMLLCRVTLGRMHVVHSGFQFFNPPVGYHSVKGALQIPEYMVYRGEQAYPEYLITYKG